MNYPRIMTLDDLERTLDWAADEGWNPGLEDAEAFRAADPEGFFVAEANGAPVAAISVVNHSEEFAFLGLYLCKEAFRGRGIAYALWRHALRHAGSRTIGLDGVPAQQANYERSGFAPAGQTVRYSGRVPAARSSGIRVAAASDAPALIAAEAEASKWEKQSYLENWFRPSKTRTTLVHQRAGEADGFVTVRTCRSGAKVGPLIAKSQDVAYALLSQAASEMGETLTLDVPSTSRDLTDICIELGLVPGFETARMFRGQRRLSSNTLYGVCTLELG